MNHVTIQPAKTEDYSAIQALLQSCQLPYEDISTDGQESFLVQWNDSELIGVIGVEQYRQDGLLRSLAVSKYYRGMGYGKALVEHLEDFAKRQKIETLYLLTTTADQFFLSQGYTIISRDVVPEEIRATSEFTTLCPESAVCMKKGIG